MNSNKQNSFNFCYNDILFISITWKDSTSTKGIYNSTTLSCEVQSIESANEKNNRNVDEKKIIN